MKFKVTKLLAPKDTDVWKKGEWTGFWHVVSDPQYEGWFGTDGGGTYWQYNCFDGKDEARESFTKFLKENNL